MEACSQLIRGFAASHALLPESAHQPLDGATCHRHTLAIDLRPDLLGAIGLVVGLPNALHMQQQQRSRTALARGVALVHRWGKLWDAADRLDPKLLAMLVDE